MTKEEAENFKISLSTQESLLKLFDKYKNNSVITKKNRKLCNTTTTTNYRK